MPASDPIADLLDRHIDAEDMAGAVTLVWREGRVVQSCARGWRDREALDLMESDAIFRIASMSKPVVSLAALILADEGRIALDDPIADWAPEFARPRVMRDPSGSLEDCVAAERGITWRDLLTHRAGLTYGAFHEGALARAHLAALGSDIASPLSPDDWIAALSGLPLIDQPGRGFHYGRSTDLLGFLIARIEGEDLGRVLKRRIFGPLGMADTGFSVPALKAHRQAALYGFDGQGALVARPQGTQGEGALAGPGETGAGYLSGGAGLWSSLQDYLRLACQFLDQGTPGKPGLLRPETLAEMCRNQLTQDQAMAARLAGLPVFAGHGFGLGLAVVTAPDSAAVSLGCGAPGTLGWPGAFGTWWQADPVARRVMIFLAQVAVEPRQMAQGLGLGVHAAIAGFHRLGSGM